MFTKRKEKHETPHRHEKLDICTCIEQKINWPWVVFKASSLYRAQYDENDNGIASWWIMNNERKKTFWNYYDSLIFLMCVISLQQTQVNADVSFRSFDSFSVLFECDFRESQYNLFRSMCVCVLFTSFIFFRHSLIVRANWTKILEKNKIYLRHIFEININANEVMRRSQFINCVFCGIYCVVRIPDIHRQRITHHSNVKYIYRIHVRTTYISNISHAQWRVHSVGNLVHRHSQHDSWKFSPLFYSIFPVTAFFHDTTPLSPHTLRALIFI